MPFDLETSTHKFERTDLGIVQVVVADDPSDKEQVALIRQHLREETRRFSTGDFSDPQVIHGQGMPGLRELSRGAAHLDIRYEPVLGGASITFRATSPRLVDALHAWAAAQVEDHGQHAEGGESHRR